MENIFIHVYTYIHINQSIYVCMYVCVCVYVGETDGKCVQRPNSTSGQHTKSVIVKLLQIKKNVSSLRCLQAQREHTVIPLRIGNLGAGCWCVDNATHWPLYPQQRTPVPMVQVVGWAPGSVWLGVEKTENCFRILKVTGRGGSYAPLWYLN